MINSLDDRPLALNLTGSSSPFTLLLTSLVVVSSTEVSSSASLPDDLFSLTDPFLFKNNHNQYKRKANVYWNGFISHT
jgi:hypothetical protein